MEKSKKILLTAEDVIDAIGVADLCSLCGVGPSAVGNWKARGHINARHYWPIARALDDYGMLPSPQAFGMRE